MTSIQTTGSADIDESDRTQDKMLWKDLGSPSFQADFARTSIATLGANEPGSSIGRAFTITY